MWSAQSARHLTTHDGTKIDLLGIAPQTVRFWVDQSTLVWTDRSAHWGNSKGPQFWHAIRPLLASGRLEGWSLWHRNVLVKLVSHGTQKRLSQASTFASSAKSARPSLLLALYRGSGTCARRSCGRLWGSLEPLQGSSHMASSFAPPPSFLSGHATVGLQTGFWRTTFSPTDLLRAVGPYDVLAGLWSPSTTWGTSSQRPTEQYRSMCFSSRLREMASTTQLLRLARSRWTRSCCTSTARAPSRPSEGRKARPWEPKGKRAHVWSRLLCSHDEVTAVKGHATEADLQAGRSAVVFRRGNSFADVVAKKGADIHKPPFLNARTMLALSSLAKQAVRWVAEAHVLLRNRGWGARGLLQSQGRGCAAQGQGQSASEERRWRYQRQAWLPTGWRFTPSSLAQDSQLGRAIDTPIVFCVKCGAVCWERADALSRSCGQHPGGCASQLRKFRSGLFPNSRFPGWTTEGVRRPSLTEISTLVAQLESCEAGLGRQVCGPSTPRKQRSRPQAGCLLSWANPVGHTNEPDKGMLRWSGAQGALLAACGVDDQLIAVLARKAEHAGQSPQTPLA